MRKTKPGTFENEVLPHLERTHGEYLIRARACAFRLGGGGKIVTVDDVRAKCPPPASIDPRIMGAVFQREHWECLGYMKSTRDICHHRPVGMFRIRSARNKYRKGRADVRRFR